ncbi:MAG: phage tail tape measure protein [Tenuifilaceae bacterium]
MAFTLQAVVALDGSKFTSGMTGMLASVQRFAGMSMTMFGGVAGQVASMWAAFGPMGGVMAGMQEVIKVGASFEQSMANVKSVTGLMGDEFVRVSNATRAAAAQTSFSTAQAADAMYALGASGMSSADMLEASLLPALKLAGATQSDTKLATEAMTAAMAIWQLGAQDATGVADLFAGAIASSPANMQRLSDAMKYAGPVGAAFGMEMKNVVDEVAAFHVVGLRGQQAGTAFRTALIELSRAAQTGSGQVGAALKGWSAETEGLTGAVDRLNAAGVDGASVIQEMGARAGPGMAALLKIGGDAMRDLSDKVTQNSDVTKMYDTQMGTLSGQFTLLKASIEELAVKLFSKLLPAFIKIIDGAKNFVSRIGRITESFGFVGTAIEKLLPLLIGGGGLLLAFEKISAFIPGLAGGLTGLFKGAAMSMAPLNDSLHMATHKMAALTAEQAKAITATHGFRGGLNNLQVGVMIVAAAFAGWKIGTWIADIRIGTKTIGEWTQAILQAPFGLNKAQEANDALVAAIGRQAEESRKLRAEQAEAEAAAKRKAQAAHDAMMQEARAADIAREAYMANLREQKNLEQQSELLATASTNTFAALAELADANIVSADTAKMATDAKNDLTLAESSLYDAANSLNDARKAEAAQQQVVYDLERAAIDAKRAHSKAARDLADSVGTGVEMGEAGVLATQAVTEAETEAKNAANALKAAQDALTNSQMTAKEKADALAKAIANLAEKQEAARKVLDRSISEYNTMDVLVTEFNMTIDDARKAFADFGAEAVTVASKAHQIKRPFSEVAENFKWIAENGKFAAEIIDRDYGGAIKDVQGIMERFGKHTMDIVRQMAKTGESAEEAAISLGILKTEMDDAPDPINKVTDSLAKAGKEALAFGKALLRMDQKTLDDIYQALKTFAEKLSKLPPVTLTWARDLGQLKLPPLGGVRFWKGNFLELIDALEQANTLDLDFSWADDLGKLNLPSLGGVGFWKSDFERLVTAVNGGAGIDLTWMDSLTNFSLPGTGGFDRFVTALKNFASDLGLIPAPALDWLKTIIDATNLDVQRLIQVADIMAKIPTGTYNASVLIDWKDNYTLGKIEGHLSTLAGLKGVIWA